MSLLFFYYYFLLEKEFIILLYSMILNFYGKSNYLLVQDRCICCFIFIDDGDHQSNKLCPEIQILCCWSLFFFRNILFLTLLKQDWIYFILEKVQKI